MRDRIPWPHERSDTALMARILPDRKCLLKPDIQFGKLCLYEGRKKRIIVAILVCELQE
jgi:hypothetical protein